MVHSPKISIIIPVFNQRVRLARVLDAIANQTFRGVVEVIVVDNDSTDRTREVAREYEVKVILEASMQTPYLCRNVGMEAATSDLLVLLDANCIPKTDFLELVVDCLKGQRKIVSGQLVFEFSDSNSIFERFDYINSIFWKDVEVRTAIPGTMLAFQRAVVEEVGLFISDIRSLGDIEWTNRAYKKGVELSICKEIKLDYPAKGYVKLKKKGRRIGGGVKARWLREQENYGAKWGFFVVKHFLPPSPTFVNTLRKYNKVEKVKLNIFQIVLLAWWYKIQIGIGLLFTPAKLKTK